MEIALERLIEVKHTMQDLNELSLKLHCQRRAGAYFGHLLRRMRVVSPVEIEDDLEAHLSIEEFRDLFWVDMLIRGQPRYLPDAQVWLAVEISRVIDRHDVERAQRRANHLKQAGYVTLPTVAGGQVTQGAVAAAQEESVLLAMEGWTSFWEQALEQVLAVG